MDCSSITEISETFRFPTYNDWDQYEEYEGPIKDCKDDIFGYFKIQEKTVEKNAAEIEMQHLTTEDTVSTETLITPSEERSFGEETSSESSTHPCLKEIEISDSQLQLLNMHTIHPVPDDPGLVPAFWTLESKPVVYSDDGVAKFYDLVRSENLEPIRIVEEMLFADELDLQYYGINPRTVKALCDALEDNTYVEIVNLKGNWLSDDACYHLNKLLLRNNVIKTLILSNCRIESKGAKRLHGGLSVAMVTKIDLSGCNIGDEGLGYISKAIKQNQSIEILNLRNNQLSESSMENINNLLASETLKWLNLSWNFLHTAKFWETIIKGLLTNKSLACLDLSWNGLATECVPYLCQFLSSSETLEQLKLNNNRFNEIDAAAIGKALTINRKLEELYIGNNPINAEGAFALISAISSQKQAETSLRLFDLENIWTNKNVIPELNKIKENKPSLNVKLGGILSNYKVIGPDNRKIFLRRAIFEAMKPKKKKLQKNFGDFVDSLENAVIAAAEFKRLIKKFKLKLSETLIDEICKAFAGTQDTVDQKALKTFYWQHYPRDEPAFLQLRKKNKGK